MENTRINQLTESAVKDCQNLKSWVTKHESRNNDLLNLVNEVEGLIIKLKNHSQN